MNCKYRFRVISGSHILHLPVKSVIVGIKIHYIFDISFKSIHCLFLLSLSYGCIIKQVDREFMLNRKKKQTNLAKKGAGKCFLYMRRKKRKDDRSDRAALKDISQNVIPEIICNLTDMKSSREKIWMNNAKPFGYEILDIKIGGVITRLKSTGYRIDNYLNGNVLRLEELEEERLPYFTKGMDKRENLWNRIISGCDLNDTI